MAKRKKQSGGPTRGPWTAENVSHNRDEGIILIRADGWHDVLARLDVDLSGVDEEAVEPALAEQEANAALISAAPELLELTELLLRDHVRLEPHHEDICPTCVRARGVIAKARGES